MDWAEELKMSIRKTTARKGRRSKSRDVLKDSTAPVATGEANPSVFSSSKSRRNSSSTHNDISVDINLDLQQTSSSGNTSNNISTAMRGGEAAGGTSLSQKKRPPMLRRISSGWAETLGGGKHKSKKGSFEDDRFGTKTTTSTTVSPIDDIPTIPDIDDVKGDLYLNDIPEPPLSSSRSYLLALQEISSDLLNQHAFTNIENVNLSILTKCLQPQESLDEPDEVWEWEKLFTDVVAEINAERPLEEKLKNLDLNIADEPPLTLNLKH